MQPKESWIRSLLLFLLEGVVLLTLSTPFSRWGGSPGHMILSVGILALLLAGGFFILRRKIRSEKIAFYFVWTIFVAVVSRFGFSLPIILSLLFAIFFMWRILKFLDGQTYEGRWWLFFFTVMAALILRGVIKQHFIQRELIWLLGVQTLLILTSEALEEWKNTKRLTGTLTYLASFAVIGSAGLLLRLIFPFIKWVLNGLLKVCLNLLEVIVGAFYALLTKLLARRMAEHKHVLSNLFKTVKKPKQMQSIFSHHSFNPEYLMIAVIVLIICLAFYYFRKWEFTKASGLKKRTLTETEDIRMTKADKKPRLFTFLKAPKDPIRAHLFYLQKKLRKREEGRFKHESVGEWLSRLTKDAPLKASIQSTYESVRYGGTVPSHLPENQMAKFETALKQIEDQLFHEAPDKN